MAFALHPEAIQDIDDIHTFINQLSFSAANRVMDEIRSAIDSLARMPYSGHRRPDLTSRPLLFAVVRNYLIAYAPRQDPIWIVAVVDGRRNPRVIASILRSRE